MTFDIEGYKSTINNLKNLSPEQERFALDQIYQVGNNDGKWFQDYLNSIRQENTPEALRAKLQVQNEFDQERMRAAAPYKLLFDLPKQISEGFGSQAALNVLGARNTVEAMNQTLTAYPKLNFPMTPFRVEKYLS
jgi:hypothetical protein